MPKDKTDTDKDKKEDKNVEEDKGTEKELPCPGSKIRSKGQGRGLGIGQGRGPIGIPAGRSMDDLEQLLILLSGAAPPTPESPEDLLPSVPIGGTTRVSVKKVVGTEAPEDSEDDTGEESEEETDEKAARDNLWFEGFVEACVESGLSKEAAVSLLKTAAQLDMCRDQNFVEGFQAELEKDAGALTTLAKSPAWLSVPSSILGFVGLQNLLDEVQRNWRRSPEQAALLEQLEQAGDYPDLDALLQGLDLSRRAQYMQDVPYGGEYQDPLISGMRRGGGLFS